jgi:tRNA(Ile)-lysidine synthase
MYHGAVPTLAQSVLGFIRKHGLLKAGDRVGVAVSGGADSVALLRLLIELRPEIGIVLSVVHFNHKLRGEASEADQQFVAALARQHKLELYCKSGEVALHAAQQRESLETAGREMRYAYFDCLIQEGRLNRIATAHTLDDQAETVLMRLARGAGTRGLASIYPQLLVGSSQFSDRVRPQVASGTQRLAQPSSSEPHSIIRPLLGCRRRDLESYLKTLGQRWREDASNRDVRHARNRVRHGILPRLERDLNPAVREALAETAEIARAEEAYWALEIDGLLPTAWEISGKCLRLGPLMDLPLALQRRVIRAAAESLGLRLEFRHVEEILAVAAGVARSAGLADGWTVTRSRGKLRFVPADTEICTDYEYSLPIPGKIEVPEAGTRFEALLVSARASEGYNPENFLDPAALAGELLVRNWRAGDRFWPAHTKAPKKIKELLQERRLSGPERKLWPVVVNGGEVVWVRGFAVPARLRVKNGAKEALVIVEAEG